MASSLELKSTTPATKTARKNRGEKKTQSPAPVTDQLPSLLSVPQLAELLHINEKKVYQLAAEGDIPCTKVTGKWLFPKQMVHDWIEQSSASGTVADRLVLSGADDLLLDRLCRRITLDLGRSATFCYLPSGSMHGLRLLAAGRADGCFFHWGVFAKKLQGAFTMGDSQMLIPKRGHCILTRIITSPGEKALWLFQPFP